MDRRNFLTKLSIGAVAVPLAPIIAKEASEEFSKLSDTPEEYFPVPKKANGGFLIARVKAPGDVDIKDVLRIRKETGNLIYRIKINQ